MYFHPGTKENRSIMASIAVCHVACCLSRGTNNTIHPVSKTRRGANVQCLVSNVDPMHYRIHTRTIQPNDEVFLQCLTLDGLLERIVWSGEVQDWSDELATKGKCEEEEEKEEKREEGKVVDRLRLN